MAENPEVKVVRETFFDADGEVVADAAAATEAEIILRDGDTGEMTYVHGRFIRHDDEPVGDE